MDRPPMSVIESFAKRIGATTQQVQILLGMVDTAVKAQVREHNGEAGAARQAEKSMNRVEQMAEMMGCQVNWSPGLEPILIKDGRQYQLPH